MTVKTLYGPNDGSMTMRPGDTGGRLDRLIFVLVTIALAGLWAVVVVFTLVERDFTLQRARDQLSATVITLADFNELTAMVAGENALNTSDARTDALWRALLQYPAASIWVESDGAVTGGLPMQGSEPAIEVRESRAGFTVLAALPEAEALAEWYRAAWQRAVAMGLVTIAFMVFTYLLVRTLRQRAMAEQEAATALERNKQLNIYQEKLERTVTDRTAELKVSNTRLEEELNERKAAEKTLREHDGLLNSVVKGAEELLGSQSIDDAISNLMELIGQTVGVSRVQLNPLKMGKDGHLQFTVGREWCVPALYPVSNKPSFQQIDFTAAFPKAAALVPTGSTATFTLQDVSQEYRQLLEESDMHSFLVIPVFLEERLWGCFTLIDSSTAGRQWNWAETDTLKTLAGLIGVAMTRNRYIKELADANMIVQNSPTILYRLKGIPTFPLIYISHNITKFGHEEKQLVNNPDWIRILVEPEDQGKVQKAMADMLHAGSDGASIEYRLATGQGASRWVENRYTPVRDKNGRLVEVEGIVIDITERKLAEEKIATMARTDALTGLANRATFVERLEQAFAATQRGARPFAILYMDLDHFKNINDTLGHPVGDILLKEVAQRLRNCIREIDVVARLGGDEFAILQLEINEPANAGTLAENIQRRINRTYTIEGNELHVTTSIGICPYTDDSASPDNMLSQADLALYRSKEEGRNRYRFHTGELDRQVMERTEMAEELRTAIEKSELELHYQPQVAMTDGKIVGMEALVRWNHPQRGLLSAGQFITVAEKTGIMGALGHWILDAACAQIKTWRDEGVDVGAITLNLSAIQLKDSKELVHDIADTTAKYGLNPADLEFDVTEAMLAQTTWTQNDVLVRLRELGSKIAIDNFGMEYSSFDYLRSYSVNHLKIDQSFIRKAMDDKEWKAAIQAIVHLATDLGIGVIAEGIETEDQKALFRGFGKNHSAQGYFYSKAVNTEAMQKLLEQGFIQTDYPQA